MSNEIVLSREPSTTTVVCAFVGFDPVRVMRLDVLLQVELSSKCSWTNRTLVFSNWATLRLFRAGSTAG